MFVQDPVLGAAALTVLPIQLVLLPKLQRRVNALSRTRIREVRQLGRQLSDQLRERQVNPAGLLPVSTSFRELERVRRKIFRLKFFIKALNNFLTALTPFLFYSLGGYFVIEGRITLGALVAVLAAHKDFSAPLKELFNYYQTLEDTRIRYHEITTFFNKSIQQSAIVQADNTMPQDVSQFEQAQLRYPASSLKRQGPSQHHERV